MKTDFYARSSEETKESFLRVVAIGTSLGFAMDHAATATQNPTILEWKPTVLGGWDDAFGAFLNKEQSEEAGMDKAEATRYFYTAAGVGLATSMALALPVVDNQSVADLMMNSPDLAVRMGTSAIYGVASSGGTLVMSFLPARHYVKPILELVAEGTVPAPTDKRGRLLVGKRLLNWARREALNTHLAYTAQKGGLVGVGLSGVLTAAFGVMPHWGGPVAANILLSIGGAAETLTTGAYLYAREHVDRYQVSRTMEQLLRQMSDRLEAAATIP